MSKVVWHVLASLDGFIAGAASIARQCHQLTELRFRPTNTRRNP